LVLTEGYTLLRIPVDTTNVTRQLPREERYESILRWAAEAFAQTGFAHTSMDDVAAACGITKLIVYRHFDSKEELYRAILQRVFERIGEELESGIARGAQSLGARTLLTVAREDPAAFTLLWRHAAREPQFAEYAGELRAISGGVVRQLASLDTGDELLDRWKGDTMFGWIVEAVLTWLDDGDPARDDEFVAVTTDALRAVRDRWMAG
jgi:AcrR family transcriptional regulator